MPIVRFPNGQTVKYKMATTTEIVRGGGKMNIYKARLILQAYRLNWSGVCISGEWQLITIGDLEAARELIERGA